MRKKKVLFVIWSFTAGGGAEKILANICNNLNESKYDISILEIENFDIRMEKIKDNIRILKPISRINNKDYLKRKCKLMQILIRIKTKILKIMLYYSPIILRKIFIKEKYDIEIAFNYYMPSILVASSSNNTKKISWIHSSIEDLNYKQNKDKKIEKKYFRQKQAFNKMDNIVSISKQTKQSIISLYPEYKEKIININNGFDFSLINELSKEDISYKKTKKLIVAVGRLVEQKNFLLLLDVAKILNEMNVECEILIIGEGYQKKLLKNRVRELNLEKMVKIMGYIENPYPYIKKADVFCLTSLAEGFPTVIAESLSLNCPFISTDVAGIEEMSGNGKSGIVVKREKEAMAEAVINLLKDDDLRKKMSDNCKMIIEQYTIKNQIKKIEKIL